MYYLCNAYSGRLFVFRGVCLILDTEIRQIFYSEDDVTRLHLMFVVLLQPIVWVAGAMSISVGIVVDSEYGVWRYRVSDWRQFPRLISAMARIGNKGINNKDETDEKRYCLSFLCRMYCQQ